ncbi:MAG: 3-phosphoshikimate 1-carboxyvinyltransferase [Chlamydiia bacterium]|nr:3-phosphoshikimate 1-carboxyvinyltransferase [Chlamydiia bacterium]
MDSIRVTPNRISGHVLAPPSKSHTVRALIFALLADGISLIENPLCSRDCEKLIECVELLGGKVKWLSSSLLEVKGVGRELQVPEEPLNVGGSGIALRFIAPLLAHLPARSILTGDCTNRPMGPLVDAICSMGARVDYLGQDGFAPLAIMGPTKDYPISIKAEDSQFVSAMIIANAYQNNHSPIQLISPGEKPYIDLTLSWLDFLGVRYERDAYHSVRVFGAGTWKGFTYQIPGDYSTAMFLIAAALLSKTEVVITGLSEKDVQGDRKMLSLLKEVGGQFEFQNNELVVLPSKLEGGMDVDLNDMIDQAPILALLLSQSTAPSVIRGIGNARTKECDRIAMTAAELGKMGAHIEPFESGLQIFPSRLHGATVHSHDDHRMAMMLCIAGMVASGESTVEGISCVEKTYPAFIDAFTRLGGRFEHVQYHTHRI